MGLFTRILEKLGIDRKDDDAYGTRPHERASGAAASKGPGSGGGGSTGAKPAAAPRPISEVDVMSRLEAKAAASKEKLNWKTSIVDLLKLLDLDSNLAARKELADELGAPQSLADGSAEMNLWLHKEVLRRIAANGGNIPKSLLD